MNITSPTVEECRAAPERFFDYAHAWAAGGPEPTPELEQCLREFPRPVIVYPANVRDALWGVLSCPERGRALMWLDRMGLLEEVLPSWGGDYFRQALRLQAVEEIHRERWAAQLSDPAYEWLCVYQDQKVDGRLNGWAVTALATLLLSGDEPAESFARRVEKDLRALRAGNEVCARVLTAIRDFPVLVELFSEGNVPEQRFSPVSIVSSLATLMVMAPLADEVRMQAMQCADKLLMQYAEPESGRAGSTR